MSYAVIANSPEIWLAWAKNLGKSHMRVPRLGLGGHPCWVPRPLMGARILARTQSLLGTTTTSPSRPKTHPAASGSPKLVVLSW